MGTDVAEGIVGTLPSPSDIKVHRLLCAELIRLVAKILYIFPKIEASRPGCSSGIQSLCLLSTGIDKAKSLLQNCAESSKLYLALTGDVILQRCKKARNLLDQSLGQIQNMVPVILAAEISGIISDLGHAKFSLDSSEEEAGKVMRAFLQQCTSTEHSKENCSIETIRFVALRLRITSQKELVIERRSIKRLLDKIGDGEPGKRQILVYLLNLIKNYGQLIVRDQAANYMQPEELLSFASSYNHSIEVESHAQCGPYGSHSGMLSMPGPPAEFKCPISLRLMYDPVVIASGVTFERMWIKRWFDEGNDTCPKTKRKLDHLTLTPNVAMKDLISSWCVANGVTVPDPCSLSAATYLSDASFTSIASLSNSLNDLCLPLDTSNISLGSLDSSISDSSHLNITDGLTSTARQINVESQRSPSCGMANETDEKFLANLDALPWDFQCQEVEDLKNHLKHDCRAFRSMYSGNFADQLVEFLKHANELHDWRAQRTGAQLFLAFLRTCRSSSPYFHEDAYDLLASLLSSDVIEEGLSIMEELSHHEYHISKIAASRTVASTLSSILKILGTEISQFQEQAIKILHNLSSNSDICSLFVPSEVIPRLVPFFEDTALAGYCISMVKNMSQKEEARVSLAETYGCISFIAKLLEFGNLEVQENAVSVLLSLCSQRVLYSHLVMDEGVIPALVSISINGNEKGKARALELLRLLRDIETCNDQESSGSNSDLPKGDSSHCKEKKKSSSRTAIFGMRISLFSKPASSMASRKK